MATTTGAFFVGVGTTFAILAMGFGGGLMITKTAVEPRAEQQARAPRESSQPVRVILPASAEPAQPPQPSTTIAAPPPPASSIREASVPEKTLEKVATRKADAEERERKRYAERKARRLAERAKRKQQMEQGEHRNQPVMAFGGDEPRQSGSFGFVGN
jgi:hypothetical protein